MIYSVSIDGVHMFETYNMVLKRLDCVQPPQIKRKTINIPGRDGLLDLTDFSGRTFYENREIRMEFGCKASKGLWPSIYSNILNRFHGKTCKVIFDDDPDYYWRGMVSVDAYERTLKIGTFTVIVDAEPHKYMLESTLDDWLWDPFDFEQGVIRNYKDIAVKDRLDFIVDGTPMPSIPTLIASTSMQVVFNGKAYILKQGENRIYDIEIVDGQNMLTFLGNGTVSIDYQGGSL